MSRFAPGRPNPAGRRPASAEFRKAQQLAKEGSCDAVVYLRELFTTDRGVKAVPHSVRVKAAIELLRFAFQGEMNPNETDMVQGMAIATPQQRIEIYKAAIEAEKQREALGEGAEH